MKKRNGTALLLAAVLTAGLWGCGSSSSADSAAVNLYETESAGDTGGWRSSADYSAEETASDTASETEDISLTDADLEASEEDAAERKLIRNMDLSLETTGFDNLLTVISEQAEELGGYIEYSSTGGSETAGNRYSYLTVRIPADQLDAFRDVLGSSASVLSESTSVQDVTLSYSDLAAHISSLRTEQETLNEMLAQSDSIETILAIQNELTNIRYQLESYESQMKVLENQISYSTVNIDIQEVKTETVQLEEGFFSRVRYTFSRSISSLGRTIADLLVFLLGNIVSIILIAAIVAALILLIRKLARFFRRKGAERKGKDKLKQDGKNMDAGDREETDGSGE